MLPKDKLRKITYHHDRKNQRKKGRKLCRRSHTKLPIKKCNRCNFFFRISFDPMGFYVVPGQGNKTHQRHNKICSETICNIDKINQKFMEDIGKGHARPSTIQNNIFNKVGKLVPRSKIQYLTAYN